MSAEEAMGLGKPLLKSLVYLLAECSAREPGRHIADLLKAESNPSVVAEGQQTSPDQSTRPTRLNGPSTGQDPLADASKGSARPIVVPTHRQTSPDRSTLVANSMEEA